MLWLVHPGLCAGRDEALAAPSADALANFKIKRWTTEDGLPQNRIACLQQTRDGYLWIGTWFGLARFDGVRFTVFNKQNTPALANEAISALAEDAEGALWIGTKDGLVKYRAGTFSRFTTADGLPDNPVWQLTASRAGGIWLQAGDKIVRCQHEKFRTVWQYPEGDTVHSIEEGVDGRLNIFLNHQWLALAPENGAVQTNLAEIDTRAWLLNAGLAAAPDAAFAGTMEGLRRLQRGQTNVMFAAGLQGSPTSFLRRDRAGNVWAQSRRDGLLRFDGTHWQSFELGEARSDVVCTAQDAQGNLWLGTAAGLVQLQFPKVRTFTTRDGLPDDNVWSVCESADGKIWAGTDHGLAMIQSNRVAAAASPAGNPRQAIRCVWPAPDGGIWVAGNENGLQKIKAGSALEQINDLGLVGLLYEDRTGRLWIATSGAVHCFQNGQLQTPAGTEALRDVHALAEDRAGNFWFGLNGGGLARWRSGDAPSPKGGGDAPVASFPPPQKTPPALATRASPAPFGDGASPLRDGLPGASVWCIHEAADGSLWLGTERGLARRAHGRIFAFTARQQMPADTINCILEDDAGCLWCSTLHGIYRVARAELNAVAEGKAAAVQPFIIGTADGMTTPESNGETQPAGWKARDGRLWFPTGKGLVVIDPKLFAEKESPPRVVLESLKADGRELSGDADGKIKIAAGRGHALEFQFTACDLAAPGQVRFQTRLAGVAEEWSGPTANRAVDYFNLRPGDYRFEVKAADHHGVWSAPPASVDFCIAPCFWQTWWFYGACALGVTGLAGGVQAYRLRWQHRLLKLEQQRAVASERARIARDLHDDLGTALTGMALELDVAGRDAQKFPALVERLGRASQHTRHLAERMREVVWMVNPRCDNLRSLADFLEDQAALLLRAAGLKVRLDFPLEIPELPMDANVRHQLALSVREAFTNLIRHAHASEANIRLALTAGVLSVHIRDNGRGFEPQPHLEKEHGLINMNVRMAAIGGSFQCVSSPGNGTTVTLSVPLPDAINKKP